MTLKNARLTRAEYLPARTREEYKLPATGLVMIESRNPDLKESMQAITSFSEYLRGLGEFKEDVISDSECNGEQK